MNVLLSNSSHMSTNVNTILQCLNINYSDLFNLNKEQIRQLFENKTDEPDWRCNFMKELLFIRENQHSIDLNENEIKMILEYLATYRVNFNSFSISLMSILTIYFMYIFKEKHIFKLFFIFKNCISASVV